MAKLKARPESQISNQPLYPEFPQFVHYFNRFTIKKFDGWNFIYLGSVFGGEVMDSHIVGISPNDLLNCYKGSTEYVSAIGSVSLSTPSDWDFPRSRKAVHVANILQLSCSADTAEISFVNYGLHEGNSIKNGLIRQPLSLKCQLVFRSNREIHRQFIGNIFNEFSIE